MYASSLEEHVFCFLLCLPEAASCWILENCYWYFRLCFSNQLSWASHVSLSIWTVFYSIATVSEIPRCWFSWNGIHHLLAALLLVRQFYTLTSTDMCGHELMLCIQKLGRSLAEEGKGGVDGGGSSREGENQNPRCLSFTTSSQPFLMITNVSNLLLPHIFAWNKTWG